MNYRNEWRKLSSHHIPWFSVFFFYKLETITLLAISQNGQYAFEKMATLFLEIASFIRSEAMMNSRQAQDYGTTFVYK